MLDTMPDPRIVVMDVASGLRELAPPGKPRSVHTDAVGLFLSRAADYWNAAAQEPRGWHDRTARPTARPAPAHSRPGRPQRRSTRPAPRRDRERTHRTHTRP